MKKKASMTRSENMARIRSKDTKPEIYLRTLLWQRGLRYEKNVSNLPGKPDLYFPKFHTAIFVNGCFWHSHKGCKKATMPKTNVFFWEEKLRKTVERDKKNYKALSDMGILVLVVWGCEIEAMQKDPDIAQKTLDRLERRMRLYLASRS